MSYRETFHRSLLPVLVLCVGCAGALSTRSSRTPRTAADVLHRHDPAVEWNAGSLIEADFDQDGVKDFAIRGIARDRVVVGIVKGPVVAGSPVWTLEFPSKGGGEDALCSPDARIALEPLGDESKTLAGHPNARGTGINLHDDKCDAFHIFWDPEKKKFEWWRL
ncbi:MAG TPA: hypothetical protein VGH73_08040 [Thermoanaerobaculia bacterium]